MRTRINCDRSSVSAGRPPRDLAELGARIREAAILAAALHLGVTAEEMSRAETKEAGRVGAEEACR